MKFYILRCKNAAPSEALFNDSNGHIYVQEEGKIIEKKYCYRCKEWHPLSSFGRDKRKKDKLNAVCKECDRAYQRNRKNCTNKPVNVTDTPESSEVIKDLTKIMTSHMNNMVSECSKTIDSYVTTIAELEHQIEVYKNKCDINNLSINDLERILMQRKDIPPRILFNAIKNIDVDSKWVFYCKDNTTGMTYPIKTEV